MKIDMVRTICIGFIILLAACGETGNSPTTNKTEDKPTVKIDTAEFAETGKSIFLQQCASCHAVNMNLTGPSLKGVDKRWKSKEKLHAFIHNSQAVIAADEYAKDLFDKWNKVQMPPFPTLKEEEIDDILIYIKQAEAK